MKSKSIAFFTAVAYLFLVGCQSRSRNEAYAQVSVSSIEAGKELAAKHCQSCHQLPDPSLLDATTWETGALPAMGPLLGIFNYKGQSYVYHGDTQMKGPGFSETPKVTIQEWENIVNYYTATAPDHLKENEPGEKISLELPLFDIAQPKLNYRNPHSCFVKVRDNTDAPIVVSDAVTLKTFFLNRDYVAIDSIETTGPLTDLEFTKQGDAIVCNVGVLMPNDEMHGSVSFMNKISGRWQMDKDTLFGRLRRPLEIIPEDLNNDKQTDYVVCEFGYMKGRLSWMENSGNNHFKKHTISYLSGAIKAYAYDYNKDGKTDILALFAQGEEGIFLYTNKGGGNFEEKRLLRFPAVYGSSHFELTDLNNDGLPDILYTCGDNADFTSILKPYHGVYIFLNKGDDKFEQAYFYPIHGCYKAMAIDFDKDGDLDLATIAYYADFASRPEEGFVYFENKGDLSFTPSTSVKLKTGRWITMDVGDIDGDTWPDIVLGNFVLPSKLAGANIGWSTGPPVMVLRNRGR
ncbi:MAG: FG-GAP-like repeat-containing protein [Chryseolinea sp.]